MCNCGCNTCETKGPLLTEGKVKSLLSEGLQYHIDKKTPLFETVYRIGSEKHLALIKEARKMYSRNVIDLCEEDIALVKTHLGEFALYEGESVPLDLPMLNEISEGTYYIKVAVRDARKALAIIDDNRAYRKEVKIDGSDAYYLTDEELAYDLMMDFEDQDIEVIDNNIESDLNEAEFKGKDVPLNKPKRGGSKAYYVYVRDPKTKKVKKVSFGSGGLRAKIKNKDARNAFAKRHNCKDKKDRTTAGYWSCNLPRYAKILGLGQNMNTFW